MARICSPADAFGQQALALLLIAEAGQVGADQPTVQRIEPVARAGVVGLLDDDLLEPKISIPHAAVFFIRPDHQEALLPRPAEGCAIDNSSLTPGLHMWHNLRSEKFAIGIAKHVLLFSEFSLQHGATPGSRKLCGRQYGERPMGQQ